MAPLPNILERLDDRMGNRLHRSAWLAASILLWPLAVLAEFQSPPFDQALDGAALTLELSLAEIEIIVRPGEPGSLRFLAGEAGQTASRLQVRRAGGGWWVGRAEDDPAPQAELRVRATVPEEAGLRIVGEGLRLSIVRELDELAATSDEAENEAKEEAEKEEKGSQQLAAEGEIQPAEPESVPPSPSSASTPLELDLFGSVVSLVNLERLDLQAEESDIAVSGMQASLDSALIASTLEIRDSQGEINLQADSSDISVVSSRSRLDIELRGSSLLTSQLRGPSKMQVEESFVRLAEGKGRVEVRGAGSTVELRQGRYGEVQIQGAQLTVQAEEINARFTVDQLGGSLILNDCGGTAQIRGHTGFEVRADEWAGGFDLVLDEDSQANLGGLDGQLKAKLLDSALELEVGKHLDLTAERSRISVSSLQKLVRLMATDSQLELDLTGLKNNPRIALRGASEAAVELSYPCVVRLAGGDSTFDGRLNASGCGIDNPAHGRRRFERPAIAGQRVIKLTAELSSDSQLEVDSSQ